MQNKSFTKNILHGIRSRLTKIAKNPYRKLNIGPVSRLYYKHLTAGKLRTHRLFGKDIAYLNAQELLHGLREIFVEEVYRQRLPEKPYIIDCGANIGLSVIYLKRLFPDAEILAFEPDERNFKLLQQNVGAFGFSGVHLREEAVWINTETLSFSGGGSTESKLMPGATDQTDSVRAVRLKDFLVKPVDFLKIDIEGAEYAVLKDIRDQLQQVRHLFLEYHGRFAQQDELNDILSMLVTAGFHYYIREAAPVYPTPFYRPPGARILYDIQLNIFCFRDSGY